MTKLTTSKNPQYKNDYQMNLELADKIVNIIENEKIQEWRQAWFTPSANDTLTDLFNLVNDGFIGINIFSLKCYNPILDFIPADFYVTFLDIKKNNLKLAKGSKGLPHYKPAKYNKFLTKNQQDALNKLLEKNEEVAKNYDLLINGDIYGFKVNFNYIDSKGEEQIFREFISYNRKFNKIYFEEFRYILEYLYKASDCGLSNEDICKMWQIDKEVISHNFDRLENAEEVKKSYIDRAHLTFTEIEQDRAYYSNKKHLVVIPTLNQFDTVEDYYETLFHEFAHSTGHASLLNRKGITDFQGFGSDSYSKEELIAELSSLYTLNNLQLMNDDILKNSIAYLKGWGENLKDGIKHNIIATIAQARKATNLILNVDTAK